MRQEMTGFGDGSGISWTICKQSAPCSHSTLTGRVLFLTPNQQRQSTEGTSVNNINTSRNQKTHLDKLHISREVASQQVISY